MNRTYSVSPKTTYLEGLAGQKWSPSGAISELADNGFGQQRGNAARVEITYNPRTKILTVSDNGVGMNHIGDLFRLGQTVGIGPDDIGRYGSGGTFGLVWLASRVRIWTLRNKKVMRDDVTWADWLQFETLADCRVNDTWEPATPQNTPADLLEFKHGTHIELTLRRERIIVTDAIQKQLSSTYAPALRRHRILNWTTIRSGGQQHTLRLHDDALPLPVDHNKRIDFDFTIEIDGVHLPVKGAVGLIEDLPYRKSAVAVGFGPRVIMRTRDCYVSQDGEKRYSGAGIAGWLDLGNGWQEYLTTTKDEIKNEPLRAALMQHVFEHIEPLLKQTDDEQSSLILDGIALELEGALNGLSDHMVEVEVADRRKRKYNPDPTPIDPDKPKRPPPEIDGDDVGRKTVQKPASSKIRIVYASDEKIEQVLCRMDVLGQNETNFSIEVNKDHEVVQELLKSRPVQKLGLNLLLTREIAAALNGNEVVMKKVLPQALLRRLESIPEESQRERLLARILMDSARRPAISEEEEAA